MPPTCLIKRSISAYRVLSLVRRSDQTRRRVRDSWDNRRFDFPCHSCGHIFNVRSSHNPVCLVFNTSFPFRRKGLSHIFVKILLSSTLLLYGSGVLYMAALASHIVSVDRLVAQARASLLSEAFTVTEVKVFESDVLKQSWMMTIALILNVG